MRLLFVPIFRFLLMSFYFVMLRSWAKYAGIVRLGLLMFIMVGVFDCIWMMLAEGNAALVPLKRPKGTNKFIKLLKLVP